MLSRQLGRILSLEHYYKHDNIILVCEEDLYDNLNASRVIKQLNLLNVAEE